MRKSLNGMALLLAGTLALVFLYGQPASAQGAQAAQDQKPAYTLQEYNAFQAARVEKDPQQRVKQLDNFVSQFPSSTLMPYVYQLYYQTYQQLKDYPKTIEYADKYVALGDKADPGTRLEALNARVQAFSAWYATANNSKAPDINDQLAKDRDAALLGAKLLEAYPRPSQDNETDAQFADKKKPGIAFFDAAAAFADLQLKDSAAAIQAYKAAMADNSQDTANGAIYEYRIGLAELAMSPPQTLDGFWALARAIALKVPDSDKVKDFLRSKILAYEQPGCESQVDAQLSEMLQLAATSADRPASYTIPSQDDLNKVRQASNILTMITDLNGGGDKAKMTWLALCGSELPEVVGKIIDVQKGDGFIDFMVFTGATPEEMQAATTANMDVKVWTSAPPSTPPAGAATTATPQPQETPQPDVVRLQKDDGIKFSGTLVSYDASPFLLHWDQVKVDPSAIPEKAEGKRTPRRIPAKSHSK